MSEAVLVALITSGATVLCNILVSRKSSQDMSHRLETHQAVTDTKIDELTREVREHNHFARRMPVVEQSVQTLNRTVERLERYHME